MVFTMPRTIRMWVVGYLLSDVVKEAFEHPFNIFPSKYFLLLHDKAANNNSDERFHEKSSKCSDGIRIILVVLHHRE